MLPLRLELLLGSSVTSEHLKFSQFSFSIITTQPSHDIDMATT